MDHDRPELLDYSAWTERPEPVADSIAGLGRAPDLAALWRDRDSFAPSPLASRPAVKLGWRLDRLADRLAG
jgi:hypothetical protein